jgi:hypothetical protein
MTHRTRRLGLLLALSALVTLTMCGAADALPAGAPKTGMVCTPGSLSGSTRTFDLVASSGDIPTPDGNDVLMWSYAVDPASDSADNWPDFQYPGPVLCANQGETVVVHLRNALHEASSIVFPGQDAGIDTTGGSAGLLTREADADGGTVTYSFTVGHPGTYLYESGSDPSKQIEMGLYGALVVRPSTGANFAYDSASTQFDPRREYLLVLGEIDPALHHAVETGATYDFTKLHDRYYTVNGRNFPDTIQDNGSGLLPNQPYGALVRIQPNSASNDQPALIRMIDAGIDNHPFHPHGNHTRLIAQDGRRLLSPGGAPASTEHFGETIGAGQTEDFTLRWDPKATDSAGHAFNDAWDPGANPLPVGPPNYLNVTFKDAHTWYSGSPYLGFKGTLPTGTASQNICGEWYFPWHSHALNEFTNFDEGFGGMATLLRVDPLGGCFAAPASSSLVGGVLKSGAVTNLAAADGSYYQVNPKTTTRTGSTPFTAGTTSLPVASAAGFPSTNGFYIRVDNEVMQVTAGAGTTAWTITRGALTTAGASHAANATITALATDWYAGFSSVPAGSQNLQLAFAGKNCGNTSGTGCTAITANLPQQTIKICDWTVAGGCSTATSAGWVQLPPAGGSGPAQPQAVGSAATTLSGAVSGTASSVTVASNAGFPAAPYYVVVDNEVMQVTGKSGAGSTTWAVSRGELGSAPAAHASAAAVGQESVSNWSLPSGGHYIGTGANKGQVRVLVHTQRWTAPNPTAFSSWGNLMKLVYDAP